MPSHCATAAPRRLAPANARAKKMESRINKLREFAARGAASLRTVASMLAERGYVTPSGRPYSASAIASMFGD